jgi:V8-like Glu-specific endopeptidase
MERFRNGTTEGLEYLDEASTEGEQETYGLMPVDVELDEDEGSTGFAAEAAETDADMHVSVSSESAGGEAGLEADAAGIASKGEIEAVPGFDRRLLAVGRDETYARLDESYLLDAYFAEFADEAALAYVQPELNEKMQEVVIGQDDRIRITNTNAIPWRWICSLLITARDGSRWIGTGWLAGPRLVVTAGHCVFMRTRGGWARSIEVIPGRNGAVRPFGSAISSNFRSVAGWTLSNDRRFDYGAIILPPNQAYGNQLGCFGFANLSDASLANLLVNTAGYPGDKPAGTMWWHARRITRVEPRVFYYNIDTAGGQSGSAVWRLINGRRQAVGIHTNGALTGNSATRITQPVYNNLQSWKNAP